MGWTEFSKRLNESKLYNILIIILGFVVIGAVYEKIWPIFLGMIVIALGIHRLYKIYRRQKPVCEYCGYVALDERKLHNHQIACEKKKQRETKSGDS